MDCHWPRACSNCLIFSKAPNYRHLMNVTIVGNAFIVLNLKFQFFFSSVGSYVMDKVGSEWRKVNVSSSFQLHVAFLASSSCFVCDWSYRWQQIDPVNPWSWLENVSIQPKTWYFNETLWGRVTKCTLHIALAHYYSFFSFF